ncbi:MAG: hypothetical protein HKN21_15495 [Candidatus Eisenbacteria bacterium]|uniref:Calcineurin-like phosphoesterase domain-containing protein n=1 Tax=Eiseniibacteriota bacterium TaxID=2212470 RepID=A0A7Y2H3W3_UNCEI|nr:hypothetical protein [Candidatus Eisenbacteria bacterium]
MISLAIVCLYGALTAVARLLAMLNHRNLPNLIGILLVALATSCVSHVTPFVSPASQTMSPQGPLMMRLAFIGDTGEPSPGEPVLMALQKWAGRDAKNTRIVFLGDNIYPEGMTQASYQEAVAKIRPQVESVRRSRASAIFIPGNHDWAKGGPQGAAATARQVAFLKAQAGNVATMLPDDQCPGPVHLDLPEENPVVRLIILDTQWWLNEPAYNTCNVSENQVFADIEELCNSDLPIFIASHHPVESMGPHGGFFDWQDHLFPLTRLDNRLWIPLPILGSLYPLYRKSNPSVQDIEGPRYQQLKNRLLRIADRSPAPLLSFIAGHDHSLQVFKGKKPGRYRLVSGAGSKKKITAVGDNQNTLFAHGTSGLMSIDIRKNPVSNKNQVWLHVIEPGQPPNMEPRIVYSHVMVPAR